MKEYTSTSSSHVWLHTQVSKLDESNPTITSPHVGKRKKKKKQNKETNL